MAGDGLALPHGMQRDGQEKRCPFGRVMTIIVAAGQVRGVDQAPTCAGDVCAMWLEADVSRHGGCLFAKALEVLAEKR